MFKGVQESFRLIKYDLDILFNNDLDSKCNYNILLALSDIHSLMTQYKSKNNLPSMLKIVYINYWILYFYFIFRKYRTRRVQ